MGFDGGATQGTQRTRRAGPERISRHWLVLSVTTLIALAYGTRVEDAFDRKIAPGSLRAPPKCLASTHCSSRSRPGRTVGLVPPRHRLAEAVDAPWPALEPGLAAARTVAGTQARPEDQLPHPHLKLHTYPCQPKGGGDSPANPLKRKVMESPARQRISRNSTPAGASNTR